ncbi:type II toxin-antitoxin system RelE/ParE family toxin [Dyadobacter sandarakinus]|uniref:Type II toxin-antitoxin system RelE/ParE family toxin n=1 Tax=Dyadobacter sandarakinus TaxID=2747268 RepID=A0ABX7I5E0_9BACT|nr:type II toxin-antitoxin system RelE/ParE family toxin [Dyadobacter sandarakinus]QRR01316.1 type II toxin-antitoxin system RelE/ParE family toxin [Dyadobacter sandarakinus]
MNKLFEILILEEALEFLTGLDKKHSEKILFNIRKSQVKTDPELFKKLTDEIWEFRTLYQGLQYRLLAFWDKTLPTDTLVVSTHGFIKKRSKVAHKEIQKALTMRTEYFSNKQKENNKRK